MDKKTIETIREAGFTDSNGFCEILVRHSNGTWVGVVDKTINLYELAFIEGLKAAQAICKEQADSNSRKLTKEDLIKFQVDHLSGKMGGSLDCHDKIEQTIKGKIDARHV